jgi:hypothetical protein
MKRSLVIFLMLICSVASAHEFWLLPQIFSYQVGQKVFLRFQYGEDFTGTNWNGNAEKASLLNAASNNYKFDLLPYLGTPTGDSARLDTILFPGNYTITYWGKNTYIEMDAQKFNNYLQEEGLEDAIRHRQAYNQDTSVGKENYMRCAKTLIRIKSRMGKSDYLKTSFYTSTAGLPLDIVPIDNPYNLKTAGDISFNIYFQGKLVRGGKAWLWQRKGGKTIKTAINIENGVAKATIDPSGTWMLSLVRMVVDPAKGNGYWQSYWGSITWGYDN